MFDYIGYYNATLHSILPFNKKFFNLTYLSIKIYSMFYLCTLAYQNYFTIFLILFVTVIALDGQTSLQR